MVRQAIPGRDPRGACPAQSQGRRFRLRAPSQVGKTARPQDREPRKRTATQLGIGAANPQPASCGRWPGACRQEKCRSRPVSRVRLSVNAPDLATGSGAVISRPCARSDAARERPGTRGEITRTAAEPRSSHRTESGETPSPRPVARGPWRIRRVGAWGNRRRAPPRMTPSGGGRYSESWHLATAICSVVIPAHREPATLANPEKALNGRLQPRQTVAI